MHLLTKIEALIALLLFLPVFAHGEQIKTLENRQIRVGIDLDHGGAIAFLSKPGGENLINIHDMGRFIQPSFYSGPQPFGEAHSGWKGWPWNPIGAGDVYGNRAKVVDFVASGDQLYVKTIPMQWALKDVPGDCFFETWLRLERNTVRVRVRLTNNRKDKHLYGAYDQELPAVYTIGKLHRLFTYDGSEPFQDKPIREIKNVGPPWESWKGTEHWAALVDDKEWGLGVLHEGIFDFTGGFHGTAGQGDAKSDATGYIAPVRKEILDPDIQYTYEYTLILGNLAEIRSYARLHRPVDTRPDYRFRRERQHWIINNAQDIGYPFTGAMRVKLEQDDPQLLGPEQWWQANDVPQISIRAAYHTKSTTARLYYRVLGKQGFAEERSVTFDIIPDDRYHTYVVDLAGSKGYQGTITGIRFDPIDRGAQGEYVDLMYISWR